MAATLARQYRELGLKNLISSLLLNSVTRELWEGRPHWCLGLVFVSA